MDVQFAIKVDIIERQGEDISIAVSDAALEDNTAIESATKSVNIPNETNFLADVVDLNKSIDANSQVSKSFIRSFRNTQTSDCRGKVDDFMLDWNAEEVLHDGFIAACEQQKRVVFGKPVKFAYLVLVLGVLFKLVAVVQHYAQFF